MADWFTELAAEACAEVLAHDEVRSMIACADGVSAESITDRLVRTPAAVDAAREQFARAVARVQRLDHARRPAYGQLNHGQPNHGQPARGERPPRELALLEAERAAALSDLRSQLAEVLALRVNEIIDSALDPGYQREFCYAGSARLAYQADRADGQVNREARTAIQAMIEHGQTGAVGLAGPAGIGKTTLLRRFAGPEAYYSRPESADDSTAALRQESRRWSVYVEAAAEYDVRDFLLHLLGQLCAVVLGEQRIRELESEVTGAGARAPRSFALPAWYLGITVLLCGGVIAGLETARPVGPRSMTDLLIAGCCAAVAIMAAAVPGAPLWAWAVTAAERRHSFFWPEIVVLARWSFAVACGVLAALLFALVAAGEAPAPGYLAAAGLGAATVAAYLAIRVRFRSSLRPLVVETRRSAASERDRAAANLYRKVKFQQSFTTGWSGAVTLAPPVLPVQVQGGRNGSTTVTPVEMSVPEIIAAFRSLTELLAEGGQSPRRSPVVIAIDELDKARDPRAAQAFFDQLKGLFSDASCLFLVAVSDDTVAAYEGRGLPVGQAFDSALSTVITLSYLTRQEARRLTGSRLVGIAEPAVDLLYVLSGGLHPELDRLIRRAIEVQRYQGDGLAADEGPTIEGDGARELPPVGLDDLAVALAADQVAARRRAVLISARGLEPCPGRGALLAWAADPADETVAGGYGSAEEFFDRLLDYGMHLMTVCDGGAANSQAGRTGPHTDGCAAQDTGAFLYWLGTVGQVFGNCRSREDFESGERPSGARSFERLARARQNFSLGPGYVRAAVDPVRMAWNLDRLRLTGPVSTGTVTNRPPWPPRTVVSRPRDPLRPRGRARSRPGRAGRPWSARCAGSGRRRGSR